MRLLARCDRPFVPPYIDGPNGAVPDTPAEPVVLARPDLPAARLEAVALLTGMKMPSFRSTRELNMKTTDYTSRYLREQLISPSPSLIVLGRRSRLPLQRETDGDEGIIKISLKLRCNPGRSFL